jgi:hypothetical protein
VKKGWQGRQNPPEMQETGIVWKYDGLLGFYPPTNPPTENVTAKIDIMQA